MKEIKYSYMSHFTELHKNIEVAFTEIKEFIPNSFYLQYDRILDELKSLNTNASEINIVLKNYSKINKAKWQLLNLIVNLDYNIKKHPLVLEFKQISKFQNQFWLDAESVLGSPELTNQIKQIAIKDTISRLAEAGIALNIEDKLIAVLQHNITIGGSYASLAKLLRESLENIELSERDLKEYSLQMVIDITNQFNAQYTQLMSSDLGYEWFAYQGSNLTNTRPFCLAMTERRYFHISEIPELLRGESLNHKTENGDIVPVPVNKNTGLPKGLYATTDASNFFIFRGGVNCGHQIRPTSELLLKSQSKETYDRIIQSPAYKAWSDI